MRLTLVHNPSAGSGRPSRDELTGQLHEAGYDVRYVSTEDDEVTRALDDPGDLVLVAGGDGAVADVAKQLVGRDVPLGILPTGTANNIARSLGVCGTPRQLVGALRPERLPQVPRAVWNVGVARGPWGEARFVEAAGVGLFARLLRATEDARRAGADTSAGASAGASAASGTEKIEHGRRRLQRLLDSAVARRVRIDADGEDVSGDYLLGEALNVRFVGPSVDLAPGAGRGDGYLALVLVGEHDRRAFGDYLAALADGREAAPPVSPRRVRQVRLSWTPGEGRLDDELWPPEPVDARASAPPDVPMVELTLVDGRLDVLVPGG